METENKVYPNLVSLPETPRDWVWALLEVVGFFMICLVSIGIPLCLVIWLASF